MTTSDVFTLGEAMTVLYADDSAPLPTAERFTRSVAGAESNVATGLVRLGHTASWVGRVGDDPLGHHILSQLRGEGVDVSGAVTDPGAPTGLLLRDCHGERPIQVLYYRSGSAGSRLCPADLDHDQIAGARILHVTGITVALSPTARAATEQAIETARANGVLVSLDPNLRRKLWADDAQAAEALARLAASADLVLSGLDEAQLITGQTDEDAIAAWFFDHGAQTVVVKAGADGASGTDGADWVRAPGLPVTTVDPVGAGDAFAAGFLSAWLDGGSLGPCVRKGALAGALAVQYPGDVAGLPRPADIAASEDSSNDVDR